MNNPSAPRNDSATYATADIGQAAYLMAVGHRFIGIETTGHERVAFKFADVADQRAANTALEFANGGQVAAKPLIEAMRYLKSVLRDVRANKVESPGNNHAYRNRG